MVLPVRLIASLLAVLLVAGAPRDAFAYLKFGYEAGGRQFTLKWSRTVVPYSVTDRGVAGVSASAFQAAVSRAFTTWERVPGASIAYSFAGFTAGQPDEDDGRSVLGFVNHPELDHVLASTSFLIDEVSGELLEADIFFNSAFPWSVATDGERGRWDLESVALHEIGHFNGLGHSAIGETEFSGAGRSVLSIGAVMFPIALAAGDVSARRLFADDIAGISDLYPDVASARAAGSISGRVVKAGRGVFGAHVVAFDPASGDQVGNFSLTGNGEFSIAGLSPGPYALRVEPLDDADIESFFDVPERADISFRATYHTRLVVVPRNGDSGVIEVSVTPK